MRSMKLRLTRRRVRTGFTLLELSMVILVLMTLMSVGFYATNAFSSWKLARNASETLRTVYVAQRTFLADNPTTPVTSLTQALLKPYLPNNPTIFPSGKSTTGSTLTIFVSVSPPYMTASGTSSGTLPPTRYDPSASTKDSLWDVGE